MNGLSCLIFDMLSLGGRNEKRLCNGLLID